MDRITHKKIAEGRIAIRDVHRNLTDEYQARTNGYVQDPYKELIRMRDNLVMMYGNGDVAYALRQFADREDNYLQRLINTINEIDRYVEELATEESHA